MKDKKRLYPFASTDTADASRVGLSRAQRQSIPPFSALRAFEAIGTCGGIRKAANELSVDHAAISRHLRTLEDWTGVTLVDRAVGSGGTFTEFGYEYHRKISTSLAEIAVATKELMSGTDDEGLRIWCVPGLASEWLSGRVYNFSESSHLVDIEFQPSDNWPNFDVYEADAYIAYQVDARSMQVDEKRRQREIFRPEVVPVASPEFLKAVPPIEKPADLCDLRLLHEADSDQWVRWFDQHGVHDTGRLEGPKFWQGHLTLAAARNGQGIALSNVLLAGNDIQKGNLVKIGDWEPVYLGAYVFVTRRDSWQRPTIVNFRRWLVDELTAFGR